MSFGKQMRLRREELHLSRAALAEELGVSPSAISNYENGVSSPKEEVLLRLFDALEIDPNYLYRDSFRSGSFVCSRAEQDLIEKCRSLSPLERETVGSLVSALQRCLLPNILRNIGLQTNHGLCCGEAPQTCSGSRHRLHS